MIDLRLQVIDSPLIKAWEWVSSHVCHVGVSSLVSNDRSTWVYVCEGWVNDRNIASKLVKTYEAVELVEKVLKCNVLNVLRPCALPGSSKSKEIWVMFFGWYQMKRIQLLMQLSIHHFYNLRWTRSNLTIVF